MKKSFLSAAVAGALVLSLSACGGDKEADAPSSAPATTQAAPTTPTPTPTTDTPSPSESTSAPVSAAELKDPEQTEVPIDAKLPQQIGDFKGEIVTTTGLGDKPGNIIYYKNPDSFKERTLVAAKVPVDSMIKDLQGTDEALGKIGACGYLYGNESIPNCKLRLPGDMTLTVGGDYQATLDEVRSFTIELLNALNQ